MYVPRVIEKERRNRKKPTSHAPSLGKKVQGAIYVVKPGVRVGNDVLKVAQGGQAVVGGKGGDGGDIGEEVGPASEVVVEVGICVGDDADGEVDACDGFENLVVGCGIVNISGVNGAQVAAVKE